MAEGAIAAAHTQASEAGADAYAAGGNAIDAALAAAAVLTVVYPHNTSIGGDLVALVRTPDGSIHCVNASGPAPRAQTADRLRRTHGSALPVRGVDTITVPGAVRGWERLHSLGARLSWSDHLAAAVRHARDGVPVARSVADAIVEERADLAADPASARLFLPGGRPLERGELLVQPALARSLAAIAERGAAELYVGATGAALIRGLQARGSLLDGDDLRRFVPEDVEPLRAPFGQREVLTSPPNTQGFALIRTLRALAGAGRATGEVATLARLFLDGAVLRDTLLADPRTSAVDLVDYRFEALLESLGQPRSPADPAHLVRPTGDTIGIAAADTDGYAVSLIQSLYFSFGATVLEPETGIQLQNRGMSFSLDPASPNVFAPGKRPRHTLMPVMVLEGERVRWVSATMGGHAQAQIHAQLLLALRDGATPAEAVSMPRWIVGPRLDVEPFDQVWVEEDAPSGTVDALRADGFPVATAPARSDWMGHANVISIDGDTVTAGSDPRADGSAIVTRIGVSPAQAG